MHRGFRPCGLVRSWQRVYSPGGDESVDVGLVKSDVTTDPVECDAPLGDEAPHEAGCDVHAFGCLVDRQQALNGSRVGSARSSHTHKSGLRLANATCVPGTSLPSATRTALS